MTAVATPISLASLCEFISGTVVLPGDAGWDAARQAYNLTIDQTPAAVALPADDQDVKAIVRYAAANGLRVAPQRTGHNAGPLESLEDVILLKTDALDSVELGLTPDDVSMAAARADLHRVTGSMAAYRVGSYLNFEEEPADAAAFYSPETYTRLRQIRPRSIPTSCFSRTTSSRRRAETRRYPRRERLVPLPTAASAAEGAQGA